MMKNEEEKTMLPQLRKVFCVSSCVVLLLVGCAQPQQATPMPTATTPAPAPTNTPLPPTVTSIPPAPTIAPISPSVIDARLADLNEQHLFSGSVLIGQRGTVFFSQGYGMADREQEIPNTPQTRYRIGSITKQFTAMAILILESQGKLSTKDLICKYFADCPDEWKAITIDHLLSHSSGIPDFLTSFDRRGAKTAPSTPEQIIARFKDRPLDFQPGENSRYSNSGYIVLGYIIEQVSGQSYEDFLQQAIFTPLNLHNTGYSHDSNGLAFGYTAGYSTLPVVELDMSVTYAAGALYSTVEDLYIWEQSLSTEQLVPQAYLDEMFAPHADIANGWAYGYGWVIGTDPRWPITTHEGRINGFAALVTRWPRDEIVVIILCNQDSTDPASILNVLAKQPTGDE